MVCLPSGPFLLRRSALQDIQHSWSLTTRPSENQTTLPHVSKCPPGGSTATVEDYRVHLSITLGMRQQVSKRTGRDIDKTWHKGMGSHSPPHTQS